MVFVCHTDDGALNDAGVGEEDRFKLCGSNLKGTDFDKLLLAINNVPFVRFGVAESNVTGVEEAILVVIACVCFRVFKVSFGNSGSPIDRGKRPSVVIAIVTSGNSTGHIIHHVRRRN